MKVLNGKSKKPQKPASTLRRTYGHALLIPIGKSEVSYKFKPGDLITLNDYGVFIGENYDNIIGVIISKPYNIVPQMEDEMNTFYIVYDVLLDGELLKMIPQEFMEFYEKHEKNPK